MNDFKNKTCFNEITQRFVCLRESHKNENNEDYVEMIDDLIHQNGEARIVDLANCFGVSQPTVTKIITRLKKENLVKSLPYHSINLTDKGKKLADFCKKRHKIVLDFLLSLGISREVAEIDAEGIEHHISLETIKIFENFIKEKNLQKQNCQSLKIR